MTQGQSPHELGTRPRAGSAPQRPGDKAPVTQFRVPVTQGQCPSLGTAPDHGQHPVTGDSVLVQDRALVRDSAPASWGQSLVTLGHCPAGNCPLSRVCVPAPRGQHPIRDSVPSGTAPQAWDRAPTMDSTPRGPCRHGGTPQGPQDSAPRTWGQRPNTGTGPQLGTVPQHHRDCIPTQGQSPRGTGTPMRGWHPCMGTAPRHGDGTPPCSQRTGDAAHPLRPPPPDPFLPVTDKMLLGFQGRRSPVPHPGSGL